MTNAMNHLDWPFLEPRHAALARELDAWASEHLVQAHGADVDAACRALVRELGAADGCATRWPARPTAAPPRPSTHAPSASCARRWRATRGWPTSPSRCRAWARVPSVWPASPEQRTRWLPRVARGEAIAAFALSEPEAGSDVAAMQCAARIAGEHAVLDGEKTWISNGGIADFYVVFARDGHAPAGAQPGPPAAPPELAPARGARGISAYIVEAGTPGFEIAERIEVIAPHPLARLRFSGCRVPLAQRIGAAGEGFKIAMRTLDVFRTSVAAAALGFARRALAEALQRATTRRMFGQTLADFQLTQAKLAQMATTIDSAALLVYRAAWQRDLGRNVTREAAMAKLAATEGAQQVIDAALQMWGGLGVVTGQPVERLYREIRACASTKAPPRCSSSSSRASC
jgi:acyl-CoA dehydrogenase